MFLVTDNGVKMNKLKHANKLKNVSSKDKNYVITEDTEILNIFIIIYILTMT